MRNFLIALSLVLSISASAQTKTRRLEVGATTTAALGIGYGTFYDIRPMVAWGKSFESVRRLRLDRTSMSYSSYNDQNYFNLNTGLFLGQLWRKPLAEKVYFVHGPEVGAQYFSGTNYYSTTMSMHYRFGAAYRFNERLTVMIEAPVSFQQSWSESNGNPGTSSTNFSMFGNTNMVSFTYSL